MGIKEEIKQDNFINEYHKLRINILHSSSWLSGKIRSFLLPFDITQKQFNILRILRGQPREGMGLTIQDIRDRMIDKRSDTSRLVDRLIKKELISKEPCALDKRHARVHITDQGIGLLKEIDQEVNNLDQILEALNPEEASLLNDLLDKMKRSIG